MIRGVARVYIPSDTTMFAPTIQTDRATVYHGDCSVVLPKAGVEADLILTSPPYGELRDYSGAGFDFESVADACVAALKDNGVIVWVVNDQKIGGTESGESFRQALAFMDRGLNLHDTMIYEKVFIPPSGDTKREYRQAFEYMFVFSKGRPKTTNIIRDHKTKDTKRRSGSGSRFKDGRVVIGKDFKTPEYSRRRNIWRFQVGAHQTSPYKTTRKHPARFPYALARDHIVSWTNPNDVVCDPMSGSGTTLRAAVDLGRIAVGCEIYDQYVKIIEEVLSQQPMPLEIEEAAAQTIET